MTKLSMVEFYIAKIESYMRRKHDSILKEQENVRDTATSAASDSLLSDVEQADDEEMIGEVNLSAEAMNE